jgi:hypothetical protein
MTALRCGCRQSTAGTLAAEEKRLVVQGWSPDNSCCTRVGYKLQVRTCRIEFVDPYTTIFVLSVQSIVPPE